MVEMLAEQPCEKQSFLAAKAYVPLPLSALPRRNPC